MASEVKIDGLAELDKLLKEFPAKLEGNILRGGIRAGSKVIEDLAKQNVPKKSGALRDSIKVRTYSRRGKISANINAGNKKVFYAHMVEFGTASHFIKPKNRKSLFFAGLAREVVDHPGSEAKPFMRPALDEGATPALEEMAAYIRKRIDKEMAKK